MRILFLYLSFLTFLNASPRAYDPFERLERQRATEEAKARWEVNEGTVLMLVTAAQDGGRQSLTASQLNIEGIKSLQRVFPSVSPPRQSRAATPEEVEKTPDLSRWLLAELEDGVDPRAIVAELEESSFVEFAEPDYIYRLSADGHYRPSEELGPIAVAEVPVPLADNAMPDATTDPLVSQQWHLDAAKVKEAWTYLSNQGFPAGGSPDVVVAVIDSGIDYTHPDLVANMWVNSLEVPNNGQDDDGNGIVDDYHGASFLGSSHDHNGDPMDDNGHGTHVAGIIAATAGNGIGGVGVAYNAKVMAIKAAQYSGILTSSDIAEALYYAVEKGADVINMSFGGTAQSSIVEDALATAFSQAVLVAAAGNNARHTEIPPVSPPPQPLFPAAYIYVLGAMAEAQSANEQGEWLASFSNWDSVPNTRTEYELMAPGVDIHSTLPDGQYAAWSGTSMSAPIVSGMAALVRSRFADKTTYSSRFVMGQIAATGPQKGLYYSADSEEAVSSTPEPELRFLEFWVFDDPSINPANDGDGIVDAGETIELAVVIKNRWGKADATLVSLAARAQSAVDVDPYVTWGIDTVDYGAVGNFGEDDNGLVYNADGLITGVANPFQFSVSNDAPNNHVIPIQVTMTCANGFDASDPNAPFVFQGAFNLVVQKGTTLPSSIDSDMTLDKDTYWIVDRPVLIPEGVTVTVTEGTQIQFWSAETNEPYTVTPYPFIQVEGQLSVQGTASEPVSLFPSDLRQSHPVCLYEEHNGAIQMEYFKVMNPIIGAKYADARTISASGSSTSVSHISHGYLTQWGNYIRLPNGEVLRPMVTADEFKFSQMDKLGSYPSSTYNPLSISDYKIFDIGNLKTCLIESTRFKYNSHYPYPSQKAIKNTVFLKNYNSHISNGSEAIQPSFITASPYQGILQGGFLELASFSRFGTSSYIAVSTVSHGQWVNKYDSNRVTLNIIQSLAESLGGSIVKIEDQGEAALITDWLAENFADDTVFYAANPASNRAYFPQATGFIGYMDLDGDGVFAWSDGAQDGYKGNLPSSGNGRAVLNSSGNFGFTTTTGGFAILELPIATVYEDVERARDQIYEHFLGITQSAILNEWWRGNTRYWLRAFGEPITSGDPVQIGDLKFYMRNNYYGTQSTELLENMFFDYNVDFTRMDIVWEPILAEAPVDCWPFVVDVVLSTEMEQDVTVVGAELVTFTVTFNRDMETSIQPIVSFGPDLPITDYSINPVSGGWADARTWVGSFTPNAITGDGYQLIRVTGAVAADDPWLVNGNDAGRFRFEIVTSGTEALTLQAIGGEGFVDLSWGQDDFDLLAGYNIYRAATANGSSQRVNASIIPAGETTFRDVAVEPGQTYYYTFRVVLTDMSESSESNMAEGTALDTLSPVISHALPSIVQANMPLTLVADIVDNIAVASATLYFRPIGSTDYTGRSLVRTTGDRWSVTLEASHLTSPGIEYYITASDGRSTSLSGRPDQPYSVQVEDRPFLTAITPAIGPAAGGTFVSISGANFKEGATVEFGGVAATNVTVVNSTQITVNSPAHGPAIVSVAVENPDGARASLSNAFTYSQNLTLYLPDLSGQVGTTITAGLDVANASGLVAFDLGLSFDASILEIISISAGAVLNNWSFLHNATPSGEIVISAASVNELSGSGALAELEFKVIGDPGDVASLTFSSAQLNDGAITSTLVDGSVTVAPYSAVSGLITYWGDAQKPLTGAALSLRGPGLHSASTDASGAFTFGQLLNSSYTLTPEHSGYGSVITAYDAALTLQHAVGLQTLTGHAAIAADVNRNGSINSMDVYHILRHAAGIAEISVAAGPAWVFDPAQRQYAQIETALTAQNFSATLLGDVSGNWNTITQQSGSTVKIAVSSVADYRGDRTLSRVVMQSPVAKVYSVDLVMDYDLGAIPSEIVAQSFTGTVNDEKPGEIRAALISPEGLSGDTIFLRLEFAGTQSPAMRIISASINEGAVLVDGAASLEPFDADGDGLLDADETEYLGTHSDQSDSDRDGLSDRDEVFAGTDPLNANSVLRAAIVKETANGYLEISWESSHGRWYSLERSVDLDGPWETVGTPIQATGSSSTVQVSPSGTKAFFRIRVLE